MQFAKTQLAALIALLSIANVLLAHPTGVLNSSGRIVTQTQNSTTHDDAAVVDDGSSMDAHENDSVKPTTNSPKIEQDGYLNATETPEHLNSTTPAYKYAVVVDCGSSGTRGHIFRWLANTTEAEILTNISPMKDPATGKDLIKRIWPGLSSVKDNPEEASDYMKPIMEYISTHIEQEAQKDTPVYFMGTAGLRLLTKEKQKRILDDIALDSKANYNFTNIHTKVISGKREGIYQWLSVNANGDRLGSNYNQTEKNFYFQTPLNRKYGMLEMGGASAQVTYELTPELDRTIRFQLSLFPDALSAFNKSQVDLDLGSNKTVKLFSATFLGFGSNSARELAVDLLVRDVIKLPTLYSPLGSFSPLFYSAGSTFVLEDPCLPAGAQQTMLKPVELLYNQTRTIGFTAKAGDDTFTVRLLGKGNYIWCYQLLNRVILTAKRERLNCVEGEKSCSTSLIGTTFVPFRYFQWLGLSEFYYTTNEMLQAAGQFNAPVVITQTIKICSTPYEVLLTQYPEANRVDTRRVLLECFKATWMLTWLQTGLLMPFNFLADFQTVNRLNGNLLDWPLGALIGKLYEQPSDFATLD